jgi:hypothetical protein
MAPVGATLPNKSVRKSQATSGRYFYNPLPSAEPVLQAKYLNMLKDYNPGGISWRTYNPNVEKTSIPQLHKGGF